MKFLDRLLEMFHHNKTAGPMSSGMQKIEHLVVLMMENRSFDHYLGSLGLEGRTDIDGLAMPPGSRTNPDQAAVNVPVWNMDGLYFGYGDPPHGWADQHNSWNRGSNDGFVREYQKHFPNGDVSPGDGKAPPNIPMGYYTRATLPVLYSLADNFTVCDHWYSSLLSSTWPNRKYLYSGRRDDDNDTQTLPIPPGFATRPLLDVLETARDPATQDKLTWRCYFSDLPFLAFWYKFAAFHALSNFSPVHQFVDDCREDRLPTVSIIDPAFTIADDHPAHDVRLGQKFIGLVVDALTHSEVWPKTALLLLYDENGAFYDHVPPPRSSDAVAGDTPTGVPQDDPLGFRVPAIVVSAYPKRDTNGKVVACSTAIDHSTLLKTINERWGVNFPTAEFGTRWTHAPSIWGNCFSFGMPALPPGIYTQPAADIMAKKKPPFADMNWATGVHEMLQGPVGGVEGFLERIFLLPGLKALDKRSNLFDTLDKLEKTVVDLKRML